jgi:hypothetical protein
MNRVIQNDVEVANMALRMVQSPEIESFEEGSSTARTVKKYYYNVLANCLGMYDWNFGRKQEQLQELSMHPLPQYGHAYKLPIDLLTIIWVRGGDEDGPGCRDMRRYELVSGDVLCTDAPPPMYIRYIYAPPVPYLPAYFIDLFIHALCEELSAVFGYNLDGQQVFHGRIFGKHGKLSEAIACERACNNVLPGDGVDWIGGSRAW